jgi:ABC-2 type transport system permease protein
MRNFFTIWRRELTACFLSPIAYVIMVVFLAMTGGTFLMGVDKNVGTDVPLSNLLFGAVILWLTVLVPIVSMRLFAEEKRSGTLETLMTAPVTDAEVVLGKYAGAFSFVLIVALPAMAHVFILAALSPGIDIVTVDPGAVSSGCFILILIAAFFTAIGLVVSLMTGSQVVAAISCFCVLWLCLLAGTIISALPVDSVRVAQVISPLVHVDDFSRGSVDTRPVVLYLTGTFFVLFMAVRMLESRRWK